MNLKKEEKRKVKEENKYFHVFIFICLIIVSSLIYFISNSWIFGLAFFLFSSIIAIYVKPNKLTFKLILVTLLANSVFLLGNLFFSPESQTDTNFWIFRINQIGFELGINKWLIRSGTLLIGLSWIRNYTITDMYTVIETILFARKNSTRKKWLIAFFSFLSKEGNYLKDFYKSLLTKNISFSFLKFGRNLKIIILIAKKYVSEFFDKNDNYSYRIQSSFLNTNLTEITGKPINNVIGLKGISAKYDSDSHPVISNINMLFGKSSTNLLIGNNKVGKTTIANCLSGYIPHIRGAIKGQIIFFSSKDFHSEKLQTISSYVQYLPEESRKAIFGLTVNQELLAKNPNYKISDVKEFEIDDLLYQNTNTLSGGELIKVIFASIYISQPKFLILDQPLVQLDEIERDRFLKLITRLKNEFGTTTLIISQSFFQKFDSYFDNIFIQDSISSIRKIENNSDREFLIANYVKKHNIEFIELEKIGEQIASVQELTIEIGSRILLDKIDFSVSAGELICIKGANGSGKTSLGLVLAGANSSLISDLKVRSGKLNLSKGKVGYAFQDPYSQILGTTVGGDFNLANRLNLYKNSVKIDKFKKEIHSWLNLDDGTKIEDLHPFEVKKLSIASICYHNELIILDEPTIFADFEGRQDIIKLVNILLTHNKGVIIISHDEYLTQLIRTQYVIKNKKLVRNEVD